MATGPPSVAGSSITRSGRTIAATPRAAGGRRSAAGHRGAVVEPHAPAAGVVLHHALEQVGGAEEVGDEAVGWPEIGVLGRRDLLDPALVEHHDPVGQRERLLLVVGDEDRRDAERALQLAQLDLELLAQLAVERAERLVEQQDLGLEDEGAGERHALLLAARELARPAPLEARELDEPQRAPTLRSVSARARPRTLSGKATLRATVMCGNSA